MIPKSPPVWASLETNYPAGPRLWNGQPCKVAPAGDIFLPNVKIPGEVLNYILNLTTQGIKDAQDLAISGAAGNYESPRAATDIYASASGIALFSYHPWRQCWLAGVTISGPNYRIYNSKDSGRSWVLEAGVTAGATPYALTCDPTSTKYVLFENGMTGPGFRDQAGTFTAVSLFSSVTAPSLFFAKGAGLGFLGFEPGSGTYATVYATNPSFGAGAWTVSGVLLPAAWQSGTGNFTALVGASSGIGSQTLVALAGTTLGTDGSRMLWVDEFGAFTDLGTTPSPIAVGLGGQRTARGVAYSATDGLWGVLASDGQTAFLYTTTDPTSGVWTVAHQCPIAKAGGLACIGSTWSFQVSDASGDARHLYSSDVAAKGGSSTWSSANAQWSGLFKPGGLVSSGNQLVGFNASNFVFSKQVGPQNPGMY